MTTIQISQADRLLNRKVKQGFCNITSSDAIRPTFPKNSIRSAIRTLLCIVKWAFKHLRSLHNHTIVILLHTVVSHRTNVEQDMEAHETLDVYSLGCSADGRNECRRIVVARSNCSRMGVEYRSNRSRIVVVYRTRMWLMNECRLYFDFMLPIELLVERKSNFLRKFNSCSSNNLYSPKYMVDNKK